jgi:hypothetical protein
MPDSEVPFPQTSPVTRPRDLPVSYTRLVPPPRPPRLRPTSQSSSVRFDSNSGVWTDVTLSAYLDSPTTQNEYGGRSFIDMEKRPSEAISPARELSSPTLGFEDTMPPAQNEDLMKESSDHASDSVYSTHTDGGGGCPFKERSTMRNVFLVLSCAGAMAINVGELACARDC